MPWRRCLRRLTDFVPKTHSLTRRMKPAMSRRAIRCPEFSGFRWPSALPFPAWLLRRRKGIVAGFNRDLAWLGNLAASRADLAVFARPVRLLAGLLWCCHFWFTLLGLPTDRVMTVGRGTIRDGHQMRQIGARLGTPTSSDHDGCIRRVGVPARANDGCREW